MIDVSNEIEKLKYEEYSHIRDWRDEVISLAIQMHDQYETIANEEGWATQSSTHKKQFKELPRENQRVMLRMADWILSEFTLLTGEER